MSPEQCRAARGWLSWTQSDLATRAQVGLSTIKDFESASRTPIANNLTAIRRAFEDAGILLLFDGTAGRGIEGPATVAVEKKRPSAGASPSTARTPRRKVASAKRR